MIVTDWAKYKNFSPDEFKCSHTGIVRMDVIFMDMLQDVRTTYNKPLILTSGYRHETHPIEAAKKEPGEHSCGLAGDFSVMGGDALELIKIATAVGIPRIGVSQSGKNRFIHLGAGTKKNGLLSPWLWSY